MTIELEQRVLGGMLTSEAAINVAIDCDLIPEDFSEPLHRDIFEDLINLAPDQRESVITSMRLNAGHGTVTGGMDVAEYLDRLKANAGSLALFACHIEQLLTVQALQTIDEEFVELNP